MRTVSTTELARNFYKILDDVIARCDVVITRWGKPVARLVKIGASSLALRRHTPIWATSER
jgi:antitoxin (DNA-binding transcriptional repressor) of toxin-antitoxin stability system